MIFISCLLFLPLVVVAQTAGGQVTRPAKKQQTTEIKTNKNKENKGKKDYSGKREGASQRTSPLSDEAAGYDVTFMCNVPTASLLIDGVSFGDANGSFFLKTGNHRVKLEADGYEDFSQSIIVNSKQRNFNITMTKKKIILSPVLQRLVDNMVYVEGGTFMMGATLEQGEDAFSNETPVHQVTLSSFFICKYEVTQEEWETVMASNPSRFKGSRLPVDNVSWDDCHIFIQRLNDMTGKKFRLPTEAEWEYAARGGSKSRGYKYAGSNNINNVSWCDENSGGKTHEVGQKEPNELGLFDMSGNVWEWCSDKYGNYVGASLTDPAGAISGLDRVCRGGSWNYNVGGSRVSNRGSSSSSDSDLGLRLVF